MKTLLICPVHRPGVASLAHAEPLPNVLIFGKGLVDQWIEHQALQGARHIRVLTVDRPDQVRRLVGNGAKWGVTLEVIPEQCELTPDQARAKYVVIGRDGWLPEPNDVVLMDHLPGLPERNLFDSYACFYAALQAWLPRAVTPDRIGVKQPAPGVWVGLRSRVASSARLLAPCWLGENVSVGPGSVIGPEAILEDRVYVEGPARIERSVVGAETFLGALTQLENSMACGNLLINWETGSAVKVPDPFVLSALHPRIAARKRTSRTGRLAALALLALTLPLSLSAMLKSALSGQAAFRRRAAVCPRSDSDLNPEKLVDYYELEDASGWLTRWPQLWNVARGEFAWVGNRPLSPEQAEGLTTDFERLWLSAPIGLFSLADAMGCLDSFDDEARAHASFYAVQSNRRLDWTILKRVWLTPGRPAPDAKEREETSPLVSTSLAKAED